ncbi:MAG: hypothetical protein ACQEP8_04360 [Chlamydiota bacterium]
MNPPNLVGSNPTVNSFSTVDNSPKQRGSSSSLAGRVCRVALTALAVVGVAAIGIPIAFAASPLLAVGVPVALLVAGGCLYFNSTPSRPCYWGPRQVRPVERRFFPRYPKPVGHTSVDRSGRVVPGGSGKHRRFSPSDRRDLRPDIIPSVIGGRGPGPSSRPLEVEDRYVGADRRRRR